MESIRAGVAVASPGKPQLSVEAVAVLHGALSDRHAIGDSISPALIDALRHVSGEAKRKNWPPEWLLIAFKATLETAPAVRRLTLGPDRDEFVARLVSQCIEEYYRDVSR